MNNCRVGVRGSRKPGCYLVSFIMLFLGGTNSETTKNINSSKSNIQSKALLSMGTDRFYLAFTI